MVTMSTQRAEQLESQRAHRLSGSHQLYNHNQSYNQPINYSHPSTFINYQNQQIRDPVRKPSPRYHQPKQNNSQYQYHNQLQQQRLSIPSLSNDPAFSSVLQRPRSTGYRRKARGYEKYGMVREFGSIVEEDGEEENVANEAVLCLNKKNASPTESQQVFVDEGLISITKNTTTTRNNNIDNKKYNDDIKTTTLTSSSSSTTPSSSRSSTPLSSTSSSPKPRYNHVSRSSTDSTKSVASVSSTESADSVGSSNSLVSDFSSQLSCSVDNSDNSDNSDTESVKHRNNIEQSQRQQPLQRLLHQLQKQQRSVSSSSSVSLTSLKISMKSSTSSSNTDQKKELSSSSSSNKILSAHERFFQLLQESTESLALHENDSIAILDTQENKSKNKGNMGIINNSLIYSTVGGDNTSSFSSSNAASEFLPTVYYSPLTGKVVNSHKPIFKTHVPSSSSSSSASSSPVLSTPPSLVVKKRSLYSVNSASAPCLTSPSLLGSGSRLSPPITTPKFNATSNSSNNSKNSTTAAATTPIPTLTLTAPEASSASEDLPTLDTFVLPITSKDVPSFHNTASEDASSVSTAHNLLLLKKRKEGMSHGRSVSWGSISLATICEE